MLLIKHRRHKSGHEFWVVPGGGRETDEREEDCVRREMKEETHLDVIVGRLLLDEQSESKTVYQRYRTYLCRAPQGEARPGCEPEPEVAARYGISEVRWFDLRYPERWDPSVNSDVITGRKMKRIRGVLGYDSAPCPPELTIRAYEPRDIQAVWDLHRRALEPTRALLRHGSWDDDLKDIPGVYTSDQGCFLVGLAGDDIVAMGALRRFEEGVGEIKRMRVHPRFQRRGYGRALLSLLEDAASRLGYHQTRLDTTTRQQAAQIFYEGDGYIPKGRHVVAGLDTIIYEKSLAAVRCD